MKLINVNLDPVSYEFVKNVVLRWAFSNETRYICVANVHMVMEAYDSPSFRAVVNSGDLVTPDGMPLVWMMRLKGVRKQERVYGPTLMLQLLEVAAQASIPVGFYGSAPLVIESLTKRMQARFPKLNVSFSVSPPFRELTLQEDAEIIETINTSGAKILFVGLGCPKQEIWMANHRGKVNAVMIGVGAAFDFHAGLKPQAPTWMQKTGLEWMFRLFTEPRRLWKRYLYHNSRFEFLALGDLLGLIKFD